MSGLADVLPVAASPATVHLSSGTIHCAAVPTVVTTILGSCVAVCLWDGAARLGGINHFVLPRRHLDAQNPRFGDVAIDRLVDGMLRIGCSVDRLRAKLFGGAAVLPCGLAAGTVGEQNVRIALERLDAYGIPVVARCTGGHRGLLIRLYTGTGDVLVHRLAAGSAVGLDPEGDATPSALPYRPAEFAI